MSKIILSVTAHPDDEVLGFGATASKLGKEGYKIFNCILSGEVNARRNRPDLDKLVEDTRNAQKLMNCQEPIMGPFPNMELNTIPHLELVQFIERIIENVKPDCIFTHHPNDMNDDHYHVSKACQAASRLYQRKDIKRISGLYFMEILSSTDWAYPTVANSFQPNTFFEVGEDNINAKIKALSSYQGVMRDFPHPRSLEIIKGLAAYRGGQAGLKYAEAFQCVFQLLPL